jgi:lactoylglutathione lyase
MLRVKNLETSIAFYHDLLGMSEMGRETYPEVKFTVAFMGYGDRVTNPAIELAYKTYEHGTAFGNISLAVDDVHALVAHLEEQNVKITHAAGELPMALTETGLRHTLVFILDPDGYKVELMQTA